MEELSAEIISAKYMCKIENIGQEGNMVHYIKCHLSNYKN